MVAHNNNNNINNQNNGNENKSAGVTVISNNITVNAETSAEHSSIEDEIESISNKSRNSTFSANGERKNGLSYAEILINFLKGMIGPGCLSLPLAFRQAGLWTGLALVVVLGFLNWHCMHKLVKCSQRLSKEKGNSFLSYGSVTYETFSNSFSVLRPFNRTAKIVVNSSIIALQIGICSVFYVFCANHIKEFVDFEFPSFTYPKYIWMFSIFVPMVLITFVRSLRAIAVLSSIGNVFCIAALTFIFQYLFRAKHQNLSDFPSITNFDGVMAACGAVLYSYEGQAMVLPLENRLKKPSEMVGFFGILSVGMTVVTAVYSASGVLGYITYGSQVKGSITQNLPQNEIQFVIVRLLFTLVMFFGFAIQMYVVVEMLWPEFLKVTRNLCPKLRGNNENDHKNMVGIELLFRAALVAVSMLIGLAVPELENIIPLVGATAGMLLALIFPALLDLLVFLPIHLQRHRIRQTFWLLLDNWTLVAIGVFGLIAGLRANLRNIFTPAENIVA
ncbi:hypothetical protein niasHS_005864 [Heterodera schachtii]|uniref:Amino acid transporter transmembrane domain-containing protein n=1 Tax=Heterodera schachtii TaxID=97005 RepID=A0ABD2JRT7_HETSC